MAALTIGELRHLARLFRDGVDGARERLELLAIERGEELAALLRFPRENLARIALADDVAALVAATIDGALRIQRQALAQIRRSSARGLVETFCRLSEIRDDGSILLHGPLLAELLLLWGPGWIVFGERGSIGAPRLRAILRECRGVTSNAVVLTRESLFVYYEAARSRGVIRLHLQPAVIDVDALHIPIADVPVQPVDTPEPPPPLAEDPRPNARARRPRAAHHGFVRGLLEAALSFALGGAL